MTLEPKLPPFDMAVLKNMQLLTFDQQVELFRLEVDTVHNDRDVASVQVSVLPSPYLNRPSHVIHFHNYRDDYSFSSAYNILSNAGIEITFSDDDREHWSRTRARQCFRKFGKSLSQVRRVKYQHFLTNVLLVEDLTDVPDTFRSSLSISLLMIGLRLDNDWPALKLSDGSII